MTRRRWRWPSYVLAIGVGAIGVLMAHHPMILSGLRHVQVDLGDSRLIHYLLEHNYRWYRGEPLHREFWNPPFFYPARNMAAYSDTMLGIAPLYAAYRAVGLAPDTSFQLWMITLSILNYAVMLHFLRRRLSLSIPAAAAGAFLFAFGSPRINMMVQQAQLPQFLSLITVDALFGVFTERDASPLRRAGLWLVATAGLLAQLSSGYYTGWFTVFSLGIAVIMALWMPTLRGPFLAALWRDVGWIAASGVLGALVMRPWLVHHVAAARELGHRSLQWVAILQPRPITWLSLGTQNWVTGWTTQLTGWRGFRLGDHDTPLGIGLTTTFVGAAGLALRRDRRSTRLIALVSIVLFLSLTLLPGDLVIAVKYLLILGAVAFAYAGRDEEPGVFFLVVGLVLVFMHLKDFMHTGLLGYGLFTLVVAVWAFLGWDEERRGRLILGGLILGLSYTLFPAALVVGLAIAVGGLLAALGAVLGWRSRRNVEAMVLGGSLLFASAITYLDRPLVLLFVALGAPAAMLAATLAPTPSRPPGRVLPTVALLGLLMELIYGAGGSAWTYVFHHVPGANAMLFVSRVGLMMLIPWAIGVGYTIDALLARKRPALALAIGVICLLEQGVTTFSFDKLANREVVSALARRVDDRCEAFYYSPHDAQFAPFKANLDAMWAGLDAGKPTVNGYSGHTPVGWRAIEDSNIGGPVGLRKLESEWDRWRQEFGRSVRRVQWIGGPEDGGSTGR